MDQHLNDQDILQKSIQNPKYFELLVNRYQKAFLRKSMSIVKDWEEVEDIVQETFLKIYKNAAKFQNKEGASFKSWGYEILRNTCYNYYKKQKAHNARVKLVEWIADIEDSTIPSFTSEMEEMEKRSYVESILALMPTKLSKVLRLYFLEEKSQKEIALIEHISAEAVRTRVHRAKNFFKKISLNGAL